MKKNTLLKHSVQQILFYRLSLTVVFVALVFAGLAYYHSKKMITNAVIQASTAQINVVRGRFAELMDKPGADVALALQDAINYPPNSKTHIKDGEFVYALLHTRDRSSIGSYEHENSADSLEIKKYLANTAKNVPKDYKTKYRSITINNKPYLDIHSKLLSNNGNTEIFLRALFALSPQSLHSVHKQTIQAVLLVIGIVFTTVLLIYPVISQLLNSLADSSTGLLTAHLETMEALGTAIAKRDSDTESHNYRVTIYAVALAEILAQDDLQMQGLLKGAFLHDVGKIGIRDNILLNKAHLNEDEFAIMQKHVEYGLDIIKQSSWLIDAEDVVGSHHEKYDGSGYPNGLQATDIPLSARIFSIADVFDALTSNRPYKEAYSYEKTMKIMTEGRENHFDPELLDLFSTISRNLYNEYSGREDKGLKGSLQDITDRYFHRSISTLQY